MLTRIVVFLVGIAGVAHAATLAENLTAERVTLLNWVQGSFSNARQTREGTNALADKPAAADAAPDLLFPIFKKSMFRHWARMWCICNGPWVRPRASYSASAFGFLLMIQHATRS